MTTRTARAGRRGRRGVRHLLGDIGALLAAVVLAAACGTAGDAGGGSVTGGSPTTGVAAPAGLVQRAADATAAAGTARFVSEARLSSQAATVVASRGEGEVDLAGPRGIRHDAANPTLFGVEAGAELVAVADVWLDGAGSRQQEIDDDRPGRVTPVTGGLGAFLGLDTRVDDDPAAVFSAELGGRDYVEAGSEPVRGETATHFRSAEGLLGDDTIDVWVDDRDRLVRVTRSHPDGAGGQRSATLELFDFGATLAIPPAPPLTGPA